MSTDFTMDRANQYLIILQSTIRQQLTPIGGIEYHEGREYDGDWTEYIPGTAWGKNDTWYRFRATYTVPEDFKGKRVMGFLTTCREGMWNAINPQFLIRINGEVKATCDTNHQDFLLSKSGVPGEKFVLDFEAYSGREYDNRSFSDLPIKFNLMAYRNEPLSQQLYFDLLAANQVAEMYRENDYRRVTIENYINKAINLLDFRRALTDEYFASIKTAHEFMEKEFYGKFCGNTNGVANCVGHTHIDVAWLWQVAQTRAKAVRSFTTELALLDEYPEHKFSSSQPQLYQFVKEDCPEIYEKIKEKVKEGRWEVEGAMWLEADTNLTSGESLIRQILHGKRFMKQEFGVDSHILWLPDVFGYSGNLPQILRKSGVDSFVTSKISWSESNHLPYDTFMWKGIDGSEVFTQFIVAGEGGNPDDLDDFKTTYNSTLSPASVEKGWRLYQQKNISDDYLISFGYGDGGGGVTREQLEMQRRLHYGIPGAPKTQIVSIDEAISNIKKNVEGKKLPRWVGELYLEFHRGTYTSMARNKRYNRLSENLLQHTETVSLADKLLLGGKYDKDEIYNSWTTVLLNQFHDIIPGSSLFEVYEDSKKEYDALIAENTVRSEKALSRLAENVSKKGIFVYNTTGVEQNGIIEVDGKKRYVTGIPALGWKVIEMPQESTGKLKVSTEEMENDFFRITLDKTGALTSIFDKRNGREVLSGRANVLEIYDDHPKNFDNWEITNYYKEIEWDCDDVKDIRVESDEVSASVIIDRKVVTSNLTQKITIYKDIERIDFTVDTDWNETHLLMKAAFPVDIFSDKATYEIQCGAIERPTHTNTSWDAAKFEVCAHKWADYSEPNYGVAMINDTKYGHDIHDGVMRLTLLKCGTYPNPVADQGKHHIRYSIMPHTGNWRDADVVKEAFSFNCPLITAKTDGKGKLPAEFGFAVSDKPNIVVNIAKEACDSEDIIIRAYESAGMRTNTQIGLGVDFKSVCEINTIETEVVGEIKSEENKFATVFKPYEIKTFRIKR